MERAVWAAAVSLPAIADVRGNETGCGGERDQSDGEDDDRDEQLDDRERGAHVEQHGAASDGASIVRTRDASNDDRVRDSLCRPATREPGCTKGGGQWPPPFVNVPDVAAR